MSLIRVGPKGKNDPYAKNFDNIFKPKPKPAPKPEKEPKE